MSGENSLQFLKGTSTLWLGFRDRIQHFFLLSKFESFKIYWLSMKFDWFKHLERGYCKSVKLYWLFQWKITDLTVRNIFFTDSSVTINWFNSEKYFLTDESVKMQTTDSINENLTDSDLESTEWHKISQFSSW